MHLIDMAHQIVIPTRTVGTECASERLRPCVRQHVTMNITRVFETFMTNWTHIILWLESSANLWIVWHHLEQEKYSYYVILLAFQRLIDKLIRIMNTY